MSDLQTNGDLGVDYNYIEGIKDKAISVSADNGRDAYLFTKDVKFVLGTEFAISCWINNRLNLRWNDDRSQDNEYFYLKCEVELLENDRFEATVGSYTQRLVEAEDGGGYGYGYGGFTFESSSSIHECQPKDITKSTQELQHVLIQRKYQGSQSITEFYHRGDLIDSVTGNSPIFLGRDGSGKQRLGFSLYTWNFSNSSKPRSDCILDEVKIFYRSLSADEIERLSREF